MSHMHLWTDETRRCLCRSGSDTGNEHALRFASDSVSDGLERECQCVLDFKLCCDAEEEQQTTLNDGVAPGQGIIIDQYFSLSPSLFLL